MSEIPGATPSDAPAPAQDSDQQAPAAAQPATPAEPDFGSRGRARRRVRFLRKARELAYRDLGGLVFNLHRFGQRNDALVLSKLSRLGRIDDELRALENHLGERQAVTVLREAGITACPRCAAIHSSEDRFCPNCGLAMSRHADLPIGAGAPAQGTAPQPSAAATAPAAAPVTPPGTAAPVTQTPPAAPAPAAGPGPTSAPMQAPGAPSPLSSPAPNVGGGGRSPTPPSAPAPPVGGPPTRGGGEELTEILRPPQDP